MMHVSEHARSETAISPLSRHAVRMSMLYLTGISLGFQCYQTSAAGHDENPQHIKEVGTRGFCERNIGFPG